MKKHAITTKNLLRRMGSDHQGLALLEFALVLPLLLIMLFGGIEIARLSLFHQRLDNAIFGVADVVTQTNNTKVDSSMNPGGLGWIRDQLLVKPLEAYDFDHQGTVIISAINAQYSDPTNHDDTQPMKQTIAWQWQAGNSASTIGTVNNAPQSPAWPSGFGVAPIRGGMFDGDRIIAVEVFLDYEPLFPGLDAIFTDDQAISVTKRVFYRARFGNMNTLD